MRFSIQIDICLLAQGYFCLYSAKSSIMNVDIQFVHTEKSSELEVHVNEKLNGLARKYDWITQVAVFLREEKHPEGQDYQCEIRLSVPGPQLFAESHSANFHTAINETIHDLGIQLEKKKDKSLERR